MTTTKPDKTFGMFVGFFNKTNHCNLSVAKAAADPDFYDAYLAFKKATSEVAATMRNTRGAYVAQSTKVTSYKQLKMAPLDTAVLNAIRAEPDSRAEL